jgi:hypothetical protein
MLPLTADAPPTASAIVVVRRPIHRSEPGNFEKRAESAEKEEANAGPVLRVLGTRRPVVLRAQELRTKGTCVGIKETKRAKKKKLVA